MNHRALKLIRQYHRLTQADLAKHLRLSKSFVSELENGNRKPSLEVLESYADFFQIPLSSFMLFSEEIESNSWHERSRVFMAKKVLKMLEWLEDTAHASGRHS